MFTTFLLAVLVASALVLAVLLLLPGPQPRRGDRLPVIGIGMALLLAVLAFLGGLAVTA
jgi:hypothetical protein